MERAVEHHKNWNEKSGEDIGSSWEIGPRRKIVKIKPVDYGYEIAMKAIEESYEIRLDYGMASRSLGKLFECQVSARHCTR